MLIRLTRPGLTYVALRQKYTWIGTTLIMFLIGLLYCVTATPKYLASAGLVAEFSSQPSDMVNTAANTAGLVPAPLDHEEIINSYVLELTGPALLREVASRIGPDALYSSHPPGLFAALERRFWPGPSLPQAAAHERDLQDAVDRLQRKDLTVTAQRNANVIAITVANPNRAVATRFTQLLIDRFLVQEAQIAHNPRLDLVKTQAAIYQRRVSDAQAAMELFKQARHISSLAEQRTALIQERSLVEQAMLTEAGKAAEGTARYDALTWQLRGVSPIVTTSQNDRDPIELGARTNLSDLQSRQARFRREFAAGSAAMREIDDSVGAASAALRHGARSAPAASITHGEASVAYQQIRIAVAQAKADWAAAAASATAQRTQLDVLDRRLAEGDAVESTFQNLARTYELADQNDRFYLQNVQAALTAEDLDRAKVTSVAVFDEAYASPRPKRPGAVVLIAVTLFGLVGGVLLALLREMMDETLNLPEQCKDVLRMKLLGSIAMA